MKNKSKTIILAIIGLFAVISQSVSQESKDEIIFKAMTDELDRNIKELKIENLEKPFYISYKLSDVSTYTIKASLGSIIISQGKRFRNPYVKVLVGNYQLNNRNFMDMNMMFRGSSYYGRGGKVSIEDDYYGIRRAFWIHTDNKFKNAAETYERKVSALAQQNLPEDIAKLPDYLKVDKTELISASSSVNFDVKKWEEIAKELSEELSNYKDLISSNVLVYSYKSDIYFINSEKSKYKQPLNLVTLRVNASTQAEDGEPLFDNVYYYGYTEKDFPSVEVMKTDVRNMASMLVQLREAPVFDDSYSGPVLFEGQAVGELFAQKWFSDYSGLITTREPIYGDEQAARYADQNAKKLEDKLARKVISNDFTIKAIPSKKSYEGINLIGSYTIDAEGVIPKNELILVEDGILKTLLNNRIPTPKINYSNGHQRHMISSYGSGEDCGPGVISFESNNGTSYSKLKKTLIKYAKNEGLEYAIIIRRLESPSSGIEKSTMSSWEKASVTKPIYVYKVSVADGSEQLVRSAKIGGVSISAMKRIPVVSNKQMVYNTLVAKKRNGSFLFYSQGSNNVSGIPASFIAPDAVLLEELDIEKVKRAVTSKPPIVSSPMSLR